MRKLQIADSFILLLAAIGFLDTQGIGLQFLCAAALHEIGHCAAIFLCRGRIYTIRLTVLGGVIRYHLPYLCAWQDACIAAAGPLCGLLAAWISVRFGFVSFAGANLILSCINLIPVRPLDGGNIVSAFLFRQEVQVALETVLCVLLSAAAVWLAVHGNGFGMLLFCGALWWNLKNNLLNV